MTQLRQRVGQAEARITLEDGKKALRDLKDAVEQNLKVLAALNAEIETQRKDMAVVDEATARFTRLLKSVGDGIESEKQLTNLLRALQELKRDLPGYRSRVKSAPARARLDELEKAVDANIVQANTLAGSLREQERDRGVVEAEGEKFGAIVKRLTSGEAFSSRGELQDFRSSIVDARSSAVAAKSRVQSKAAKAALDKMIEQYDGILNQIDAAL
jgi:hypothetical protein